MGNILQSKHGNAAIFIALFILSIAANSFYRGIAHDEGLGSYCNGAIRILSGVPLVVPGNELEDSRYPARLLYMIFIAIGVKLLGWNLAALHLFPYLIQLFNPLLFFIAARRFFNDTKWAIGGTLLFLVHPFDVVFLNQQYSSPFFDFLLLALVILFQRAIDHPKLLIWFGVCSSLLLFTRLEDGIIFVSWLYFAYLLHCWKHLPWKWLAASLGAFVATHAFMAWYFQFPLSYPVYAIRRILGFQANYGAGMSYIDLTKAAIRNFTAWYFGGKFLATFVVIFLLLGTFTQIRTRIFYPACLFFPHFLFMLLVYNGRKEVVMLGLPYTVIPFLLLLMTGMQTCLSALPADRRKKITSIKSAALAFMLLVMLAAWAMQANRLGHVMNDTIPSASIWRIIKANPPLPGHPSYQEPVVRLTPEETLPIKLRETVYQQVLGTHRPEGFEVIGKYTKENHLFETMAAQADFSYVDTYDSKERWETDRRNFAGDSTLWNDEYPGKLGAFPLHASGSFEYHFTFPKQIEYVIIQDTHSQWGPKDRMRLWTSSDGKKWTVRYGDLRARYKSDPYYQFFDSEFDGQTTLFIKYEFYAGDAERKGNDNRGASLDEFGLLVKYRQ